MEYKPFSKKQMMVFTWWNENSKYRKYDAVICDGAVRSGKTFCMSLSFVLWAFSRFDGHSFAMCGKTIKSLRRNLITPLYSPLKELGFSIRTSKAKISLRCRIEEEKTGFMFSAEKTRARAHSFRV